MAKTRAGTLRHVWSTELPLDLKIRIYIVVCCIILTYGSEAWFLSERACKIINGANAYMLSHITDKSKWDESSADTSTFNILVWIRARRLRWDGHILRMGDERLVKQTLKVIYDNPQEGDMLMDVEAMESWEQLVESVKDRKSWKKKVVRLKRSNQRTTMPIKERKLQHQRQKASTKTRSHFIFYPSKEQRTKTAEENEDNNFFKQSA